MSSKTSSKNVSKGKSGNVEFSGTPGFMFLSLTDFMFLALTIKVIYNIIILLYVYNLENKKCNCITDWRHDFIKYYTAAILIWIIISFVLHINKKTGYGNVVLNISMVLGLINIYCLYTYVGDLDATNCTCAIVQTRKTHYFLYVWRYVLVGLIILALLGVILGSMSQIKL